eukprot:8330331-Ditylum_brightwellii.AAC.1
MTEVTKSEQPSSEPSEQVSSVQKDKPTEQDCPKAQMMWTNEGDTSKNTQLTNANDDMLMAIKQLKQQIKPNTMPTEQHAKPRELLHRELQKGERKRDQGGTNKPPAVPISHPTHHDITHQNGPNSGSEGEECPEMEHKRSKVGPVPKK